MGDEKGDREGREVVGQSTEAGGCHDMVSCWMLDLDLDVGLLLHTLRTHPTLDWVMSHGTRSYSFES